MSRTRLILLATALFLTLSATAGLAAANLPGSVTDDLDAAGDQLQTIVSDVLPNLLPDPVPDGAVPFG